MSKLSAVAQAFDWQSYVEQHYQYKPTWGSKGEELRICCPFCGESDFKCYINPSERLVNCFKCFDKLHKKDCYDFVAVTEHISRGQAVLRLVAEYKDVTPDAFASLEDEVPVKPLPVLKTVQLPPGAELVWYNGITPTGEEYFLYLHEDRGLTYKEIAQLQSYHVELFGKRVLWPIYGGDGQLVSWCARTIENHKLKYKMADGGDSSKTFWPYVKPKGKRAILVEGMLDCVALRRLYDDVYACFGKKLSEAQITLLQSWGITEVVLFWDRKDAKTEMKKTAQYLETRFSKVCVADVRNWPTNSAGDFYDTGDFLKHPEVGAALTKAVDNALTLDSVDFLSWELDD